MGKPAPKFAHAARIRAGVAHRRELAFAAVGGDPRFGTCLRHRRNVHLSCLARWLSRGVIIKWQRARRDPLNN